MHQFRRTASRPVTFNQQGPLSELAGLIYISLYGCRKAGQLYVVRGNIWPTSSLVKLIYGEGLTGRYLPGTAWPGNYNNFYPLPDIFYGIMVRLLAGWKARDKRGSANIHQTWKTFFKKSSKVREPGRYFLTEGGAKAVCQSTATEGRITPVWADQYSYKGQGRLNGYIFAFPS